MRSTFGSVCLWALAPQGSLPPPSFQRNCSRTGFQGRSCRFSHASCGACPSPYPSHNVDTTTRTVNMSWCGVPLPGESAILDLVRQRLLWLHPPLSSLHSMSSKSSSSTSPISSTKDNWDWCCPSLLTPASSHPTHVSNLHVHRQGVTFFGDHVQDFLSKVLAQSPRWPLCRGRLRPGRPNNAEEFVVPFTRS